LGAPGNTADRVPILWSEGHKERLRQICSPPVAPATLLDAALASAVLKCADGCFLEAEQEIFRLLSENLALCATNDEAFIGFLDALFTAQRFDFVAAMVRDRYGYSTELEVDVRRGGRGIYRVRWEILPSGQHRFTFDAGAYESDQTRIAILLFQWIFPLCSYYAQQPNQECGSVVINLGDIGEVPGLAFCDSRPDRFLVPDTVFVPSKGYSHARQIYDANNIAWNERNPVAFWRGATTGIQRIPGDWRSLERVRLCALAQSDEFVGLIDAGISKIAQFDDLQVVEEIKQSGVFRDFVPWQDWNQYKYHIDIDGNTNAWEGFFLRLLTGSPVLKIESGSGRVQWFYDRLVPWKHYVPVAPDMSDLADKIRWLVRNPSTAQRIGQHGREFADAATYEREIERAVPVISAAFRYFCGQGKDIEPYGRTRADDPVIAPEPTGADAVPARGDLDAAARTSRSEAASAQITAPAEFQDPSATSDRSEIIEWCSIAARRGHAEAQFRLGVMYCTGEGLPQDVTQATLWYSRAAEQGHRHAQHNLAVMLLKGEGIPRDAEAAFQWFSKAAEQGVPEAQLMLGDLYAVVRDAATHQEAARQWYHKAAAQGNAVAATKLKAMNMTLNR
jgi:hypothetical protein